MIYFNNVTKRYKENEEPAIEDVSFSIAPGEFVSIIGHSGAGKTTLAKLIIAEERPTEGTVFFESSDIHKLSGKKLSALRRRIGIIFQDFRLIPNRNTFENVAFAMEASGKNDEEITSEVVHVLELVDLGHRALHFPHQLSGGEKQRLAIARAIITQPDIIIADEPTGNLDPANANQIIQILKKINELGTTIILNSHNRGVVDALKKRVITLEKGRIKRDDKTGKYVI